MKSRSLTTNISAIIQRGLIIEMASYLTIDIFKRYQIGSHFPADVHHFGTSISEATTWRHINR